MAYNYFTPRYFGLVKEGDIILEDVLVEIGDTLDVSVDVEDPIEVGVTMLDTIEAEVIIE